MINKLYKKMLYTLLLITGAFLLLIVIVNRTFIGKALGKLIDEMLVSYSYDEVAGVGMSTVDWARFKMFFIVVTILLLLIISGAVFLVVRHVLKTELGVLAKDIPKFMENDDTNLLEEYPELGYPLAEVRNSHHQAEELYRKETQRTKDMITYLAHDLKTPLASMVGYLNLLCDIQDLPLEKREKYLAIALEKGDRLEELINELFDVVRFDLDSMGLHVTEIPVQLFLDQMSEEFYPMLQEKQQRIILDVAEDLVMTADPEKIARVINNLLKNAVYYGRTGSEILIEASQPDEHNLLIKVSNEGNTIPEKELEMIFEKFYRLDKSRSTKSGGGGLGLAIAKEIVRAHEGTIAAESKDGLTTFTIELPFLKET